MKDVNNEKSLVDCEVVDKNNLTNIDPVPLECADDKFPNQKRVGQNPEKDWNLRPSHRKTGLGVGQQGNCDPIQSGEIYNDLDTPNRDVIHRYGGGLRGSDSAMFDLFRNVKVLDLDGKAHQVPLVWGSQEKAVAAILQDNVRKDNSLVVDRIRLPVMALNWSGYTPDRQRFTYQKAFLSSFYGREKEDKDTVYRATRGIPINATYSLYIWTLYEADMKQILEQVFLRFSPVAYIRVKSVLWEIIVTLDNSYKTPNDDIGDNKLRILKHQFDMTAQTYIPQPLTREKPSS